MLLYIMFAHMQILTMTQQALCVVKGFPYMPEQPRLIETIAALHDEPPISHLTQSQGVDDFEHHIGWQQIVDYLRRLNGDNIQVYVPMALT